MGFRRSSLRTKVVALLVTLTALWAFGAWVTLRDGLNLLWVQTLDSQVYQPTEPLVLSLQLERRLSMSYLGGSGEAPRSALAAARSDAEADAATFRKIAQGWWAELASDAHVQRRVAETVAALDRLAAAREGIDARRLDRVTAAQAFTDVINAIYRTYGWIGNLGEAQIDRDIANLTRLSQARELIAQEDALLAGAFAGGRLTPAEHARFVQLVGAREYFVAGVLADLPAADLDRYQHAVQQGANVRFRAIEEQVVLSGRPGGQLPVTAEEWRGAIDPAMRELSDLVIVGGDELLRRTTPFSLWVVARMLIAAGLGLIAVIISVNTARTLVRQLNRLRGAALRLANEQLPDIIARLGRGETVDLRAEAPPLAAGRDEIGQVAQAFNVAQETAIRTAVQQAELRRGVRDIFLNLARRTQALLHRQLTLLDAMERRENDPEELEDLFRVDHLATRMRRNAENLIVLSGSTPGRAWRRNVPMVDVVRGAVAEVEDYARVTVLPIGAVDLAGRAVGDVIHLLAELIENALSFSPPHTGVQVQGQMVANGYAIEIEDRGLGMSDEDRDAANERIASQPEFSLSATAQLGLYVVSRLTERHGVRVRLKESPYGGTTAVVLIPLDLVTDRTPSGEPSAGSPPGEELAVSAIGAERRGLARTGPVIRPGQGGPGGVTVTEAPPAAAPAHPTGPTRPADPMPPADGPGASPAASEASTPEASTSEASTPEASTPEATAPAPATAPATAPAPVAVPAAGAPAETRPASLTPSGLPVRVRQANLTPALRAGDTSTEPGPAEPDPARTPEEIRRMMSSYQSGTRRGRAAAARPPDEGTGPPSAPAGT